MADATIISAYTCAQCGAEFNGHKRKYCTPACREAVHNARNIERKRSKKPPIKRIACGHCKLEFMPAHRGNTAFCSARCKSDSFRRLNRDAIRLRANEQDRQRRLLARPANVEQRARDRAAKKAARTEAKAERRELARIQRLSLIQPAKCKRCGVTFKPESPWQRVFCSRPCRRREHHGERGTHRRRAIRAGVAYEPISSMKVFDRDGWRCQICGVATPKKLRGSCEDRAPELDHRIPIAMGGGHTWDNVQCACRRCNNAKGHTLVVGQMRLGFDLAA